MVTLGVFLTAVALGAEQSSQRTAGTGLPPDADAAKKMAAEERVRNMTTTVGAWWLNHDRPATAAMLVRFTAFPKGDSD